MSAYDAYFAGELESHEFTQAMLDENMKALADMPTL